MKTLFWLIFGFLGALSLLTVFILAASVPVWFLWNWLAPTYLPFLPGVWLNIPFLHFFGLNWILMFVGSAISGTSSKSVRDGIKAFSEEMQK